MAHELDTTNGITAFADSRTDAWHQLGQQVGHLMTGEEALEAAYLGGWDVRKQPIWTADEQGNLIEIDDRFATVRTNPVTGATDYLGVVGKGYHPVQNEDTVGFLDALIDESGAHFETAGSLREGREVFVTMKLPNYMEFNLPGGGTDRTDLYLAALNGHDGLSSFKTIVTPVRIVCANTQSAALANAKSSWAVRHTSGALSLLEQARQSLRIAFTYGDAFSQEIQKLIDSPLEPEHAEHLAYKIFQVDDAETERAKNMREAHAQNTLQGLRLPTCEGIADTRYGLYNAVTEYVDHRIEVKGVKGVAADKQLFGAYAELKQRAFSVLTGV